jgi:hypothetical protein
MVDIMNWKERVSHDSIFDGEDPTHVAELSIRLLPRDTRNRQLKRPVGRGLHLNKERIDIANVRARLQVAIEAEAATVPEVGAEIIDEELSRIMSPRSAVNDPAARRLGRHASRNRRPSLAKALRGSGVRAHYRTSPDRQEPTAAAELHITLVHR